MCTLANKIKYLREQRNLTKKEIADAVGVHPSSIGNLEKGSIPQADLLFKLSIFFNVSMEYLMDSSAREIEYAQSKEPNLSYEESSLLNLYRQLPDKDKCEVKELIEFKIFKFQRAKLSPSESGNNSTGIA